MYFYLVKGGHVITVSTGFCHNLVACTKLPVVDKEKAEAERLARETQKEAERLEEENIHRAQLAQREAAQCAAWGRAETGQEETAWAAHYRF